MAAGGLVKWLDHCLSVLLCHPPPSAWPNDRVLECRSMSAVGLNSLGYQLLWDAALPAQYEQEYCTPFWGNYLITSYRLLLSNIVNTGRPINLMTRIKARQLHFCNGHTGSWVRQFPVCSIWNFPSKKIYQHLAKFLTKNVVGLFWPIVYRRTLSTSSVSWRSSATYRASALPLHSAHSVDLTALNDVQRLTRQHWLEQFFEPLVCY